MATGGMNQLPYFRDYVEQILRPRVVRLVEEVRAGLDERVWNDLLTKMAEDQQPGSSSDPATLAGLKQMLQGTLGMSVSVNLQAEFDGQSVNSGGGSSSGGASGGGQASGTVHGEVVGDGRQNVDVVNHKIPDNPLVRSVLGIRKAK